MHWCLVMTENPISDIDCILTECDYNWLATTTEDGNTIVSLRCLNCGKPFEEPSLHSGPITPISLGDLYGAFESQDE